MERIDRRISSRFPERIRSRWMSCARLRNGLLRSRYLWCGKGNTELLIIFCMEVRLIAVLFGILTGLMAGRTRPKPAHLRHNIPSRAVQTPSGNRRGH
jgi:hypothetical protein